MQVVDVEARRQAHEIYVDHHGWLKSWLRRRLDNAFDAADLAHDTFIRLMSQREAAVVNEPRALLTTIARGLVSNFYRRRRVEEAWLETLAALPEPQVPGPERRALLLEALLEIDRRLDALAPRARRAFLLSQLDGLKQSEIAAELGVSLATVQRDIATAAHQCFFAE